MPKSNQINVVLDDWTFAALRIIALADDTSIPELVRPVIGQYIRDRMEDVDLAAALEAVLRSRDRRKADTSSVSDLTKRRKGPSEGA